jgi:NADH-quinone oxidoreductase subunit H
MRSAAQMVSYEIAMGLAVVAIFMRTGGYDPQQIIEAQRGLWNVLPQAVGFLVFFVCMFAETNRLPFDFAEGESEIVAGFHTEYGSMKFALLQLSEYVHIVTASALIVTLFFGGWRFAVKLVFFCWVFIWVRWTIPRFRFDQLMFLGWKVMLPLSLGNLLLQAWLMHGGA